MQTIIALLFCLALGVMVKAQGWLALVWVPLGFAVGLFVTAQIALPLLLGLPRAARLVSGGEMRSGVYWRLLFTPVVWVLLLFVILFLVGFFWPSAAAWVAEQRRPKRRLVARYHWHPVVAALEKVARRFPGRF